MPLASAARVAFLHAGSTSPRAPANVEDVFQQHAVRQRCSASRRRWRRQCMMVHCTVVQPFIVIMGSIELRPSERVELQGGRSWVELWVAGRGGCCCCLRDLAELPGAAGPWVPEPRCSRSTRTAGRTDPCSLVSMSRLVSPHLHIWSVSRGPGRDDLSSSGPCHGVCVRVRGRVAMVLRCVRYARLDRSRFTRWHGLGRGPCLKDGSEPRLKDCTVPRACDRPQMRICESQRLVLSYARRA